jgi:hypothetical protein
VCLKRNNSPMFHPRVLPEPNGNIAIEASRLKLPAE